MEEKNQIYLVASECITSLGNSASVSTAAFKAGISLFAETAFLNKKLNPIKMALVPDEALPKLKDEDKFRCIPSRQQRLIKLISAAMSRIADKLPPKESMPLFLALPEFLPGRSMPMVGNFIELLASQSEVPLEIATSKTAEIGRTGGIYAIEQAFNFLIESGKDYALIGGVDSYFDPLLLSKLDADGRLHALGVEDGFLPGEGACILLLASSRIQKSLPKPWVKLYKPGFALESDHFYSDQTNTSEALDQAVKSALKNASLEKIQALWTTMTFESFGQKELGIALTRNSNNIKKDLRVNHPTDCFGDLGAASSPVIMMLIAEGANKEAVDRHHLICSSSDQAHRAAIRIDIE